MENPKVACPEDELPAIGDWESERVYDAAGVPGDGLEDDASFAQGGQKELKGW